MKVLIIGGTGLIGSFSAKELIVRGHKVKAVALPPLPEGEVLPPDMEITYGNYLEMSDEELRALFSGIEGLVFAAGIDERFEGKAPIYDLYYKYNIAPLCRLLKLAKECGVKHAVICGSYFTYFSKIYPELELPKHHPYIRSRLIQEEVALGFGDESFDVAVLELPYIFGVQPGRKPVWVFMVEMIMKMKKSTYWTGGGSAMLTVKQVAQAICGALEKNKGAKAYPIGYYNLTWVEMLKIIHEYLGQPNKKIVIIPNWLFGVVGIIKRRQEKKRGVEGGLHLRKFAKLQCRNQFIDKDLGSTLLGVKEDNLKEAIGESVLLSREIIENKHKKIIDMKAE